MTLCGTQMRKA